MAKIIGGSIDLNKIDKSKIVEGKNGAKYYNITIIVNDEKDTYGNDVSLQEGQTKEQRDAKAPKKYIGNGKTIWEGQVKKDFAPDFKTSVSASESKTFAEINNDSDGLPF
jgi:hypothetical protein